MQITFDSISLVLYYPEFHLHDSVVGTCFFYLESEIFMVIRFKFSLKKNQINSCIAWFKRRSSGEGFQTILTNAPALLWVYAHTKLPYLSNTTI